jgi:hypothetical protein
VMELMAMMMITLRPLTTKIDTLCNDEAGKKLQIYIFQLKFFEFL